MGTIMMTEQTNSYKNKKEIFFELRDKLFKQEDDVRLSTLKNSNVLETIKTIQIIELDDLKSFYSYINYDHFLIFKFQDEYYFCDTQLAYSANANCMIKIIDFNYYLRKDKINQINEKNKCQK